MKPVSPQVNFPEVERAVLSDWKANDTFKKSLDIRKNAPKYFFYDGPPFANGTPHYGHLLQGTVKDIIPRYQTMKGFYVERRFGWDTHGLPIEMEIEKQKNLNGRLDILALGVAPFNDACKEEVFRLAPLWEEVTVCLVGL
jgi:isoleucyl-tRNA synthetase